MPTLQELVDVYAHASLFRFTKKARLVLTLPEVLGVFFEHPRDVPFSVMLPATYEVLEEYQRGEI